MFRYFRIINRDRVKKLSNVSRQKKAVIVRRANSKRGENQINQLQGERFMGRKIRGSVVCIYMYYGYHTISQPASIAVGFYYSIYTNGFYYRRASTRQLL